MQKSVRYNEGHALYLALLARKEGTKRGYLSKKTAETNRWHEKWFALYQNVLFYFEGEQSARPAGMYMLEGCNCERVPAPKGCAAGSAKDAALDKQVPPRAPRVEGRRGGTAGRSGRPLAPPEVPPPVRPRQERLWLPGQGRERRELAEWRSRWFFECSLMSLRSSLTLLFPPPVTARRVSVRCPESSISQPRCSVISMPTLLPRSYTFLSKLSL